MKFEDIIVGSETAILPCVFSDDDVRVFGNLSGDKNPLHYEKKYAESKGFDKPLVHGILLASKFSFLVGMVIPGANSGIGRATAVLAAKEGANVIVNYLKNEKEAEKVVKELQGIGSDAVAIEADVSNYDEVLKMSLIVKEKYGKINGIVNNASASLDYKRFADSDWNDFKKHIEAQIHGAFNVVKAFLPLFANGEAGSIVNIASRVTLGSSAAGISGYATAKYGLIGLTNALANE